MSSEKEVRGNLYHELKLSLHFLWLFKTSGYPKLERSPVEHNARRSQDLRDRSTMGFVP